MGFLFLELYFRARHAKLQCSIPKLKQVLCGEGWLVFAVHPHQAHVCAHHIYTRTHKTVGAVRVNAVRPFDRAMVHPE